MELYELPFVKIIKIDDDIAEVIVNDGVDYDMQMAEQYEKWITDNMADPCYIMVNRVNSYSYSFEVQQRLGSIRQIRAIALVAYTRTSHMAAKALSERLTLTPRDSRIFDNREDALQWLAQQRNQVSN